MNIKLQAMPIKSTDFDSPFMDNLGGYFGVPNNSNVALNF